MTRSYDFYFDPGLDIPGLLAEAVRRMMPGKIVHPRYWARMLHALGMPVPSTYDDDLEEPNGPATEAIPISQALDSTIQAGPGEVVFKLKGVELKIQVQRAPSPKMRLAVSYTEPLYAFCVFQFLSTLLMHSPRAATLGIQETLEDFATTTPQT
jgi:hypothetical protein